ncbi:unnamed protein product [Phaedon cochleariae]|uniref:Endonuclease-reverse transcriptase n=1 Tax=Phaedon cochleariae TaxID=80249 RepID=A0A9P0DL78_PHACE|nr:unnamed protein product [Phaedon cochleariae]
MGDDGKGISLDDVYRLLSIKLDGVDNNVEELGSKLDKEVLVLKNKIREVEETNRDLQKRLDTAERKLKYKNLIFFGINEQQFETDEHILQSIKTIIIDNLGIQNFYVSSEIANAYRLGRKTVKSRPLLVEFVSNFTKKVVVSKRSQLKGRKIFIAEDLTEKERIERKILVEAVKRARSNRINAFLRGNKLVVNGEVFSYDDVLENKHSSYYSPPAPSQAASVPSNPSIQSLPCFPGD